MARGADVSPLFPELLRARAAPDPAQKRLAQLYVGAHARGQPELALLAVNTLRTDCAHPSPLLRGLALRGLCALRCVCSSSPPPRVRVHACPQVCVSACPCACSCVSLSVRGYVPQVCAFHTCP